MTANLALINDVQLRFLCAEDVDEVKRLCREWFPIDVQELDSKRKDEILTDFIVWLIIIEQKLQLFEAVDHKLYPDAWYKDITSSPRFFSLAATHCKAIIGLVVAEVKPRLTCNREDSGILEYTYQDKQQVAYILSIGVAKEYRRQKIASLLLDSLISNLTTPEQQDCKAIYLHVLSSNMAAIRFYETRCFRMFSYLPMYYAINGTQRDGCLYVLYINGGKPPWTFSDAIKYAGSKLVNLRPCKLPMYIFNSLYGWILWFSPEHSVRDSCVRIM